MIYSNRLRTPSQKSEINSRTFSFLDGFSDEKQQKTMHNSQSKSSDFETTSCCTCSLATEYQKEQQEPFYTQAEDKSSKTVSRGQLDYGIIIARQINYRSPQQYQEQLENLLNDIKIAKQNKIYLRLIVLDQIITKDNRLQNYFQRALQQYRQLKQQYIYMNFNSAQGCCRKHS